MQVPEKTMMRGNHPNRKKGRIAIIVLRDSPSDGRLERQYLSLISADYDVQKLPIFTGPVDKEKNITHKAWLRPFLYRARRYSLLNKIKRFKPDLIISHEPEALSVTGHYLKTHETPHIYDAHEFYDAQRGITENRKAWLKKTYQRYGSKVNALITVSPGLIDLYRENHPSLPTGILIANAARFSGVKPYDGRLHREIGVTEDTKILLYQGGLWRERGIEDICEASTLLPPNWVTVIMGYGPLLDRLPSHEKLFLVSAKPQSELFSWTAGASLGIIPYPDNTLNHRYCLPNKLWEFPNAGVPIIARDLPDLSKIIQSTNIGVLFPRDANGADIAKAVSRLKTKALIQMKKNCHEFSQIENWRKYEAIYLDLIEGLLKN